MERLTHDMDFGLEDWEETLFFVKSDPNGAYNILDIARFQGEAEFDEILKNIALRLAAYEDTGLAPEEVQIQKEAMESMGWFGKMFQRYKGDPRGPIGTLGTALGKSLALLIVESAKNRQPVKDVDGNTWLPMLLDEFESMADVIEHGQEWIPVEERLPEEKQRVIVRCERVGTSVGWILWGNWMTDIGPGAGKVTHWMPPPAPPYRRPPEGEEETP